MAGTVKHARVLGNLEIVDQDTPRGPTIGHRFFVEIELTDIRHCVLEWWEKTNVPYEGLPETQTWVDMFGRLPTSDVFENWMHHFRLIPLGDATFEMRDRPGIMVNACPGRKLCIEVRVKENNIHGDKPNRQRRIRLVQTLHSDSRLKQLDIVENDIDSPAETGPPSW